MVSGSPEQSDLPLQFAVWWEEVRRLVSAGEPPWVSDRIGGGSPLFANGQTELPFPLQAPVWALGATRGTDVMAVWKLELAAIGVFVLLRRLRLAAAAAAVGGLAFAFGLYSLSWLVVPLAWVVAATPWAWWALVGALRGKRRDSAVLAAVLGVLAGWSVHAETAAFLWLAIAGAGVVMAWGRWRRIRRLAGVFLLAAAVAGVGAIPTLAAIADSSKLAGLRSGTYPDPGVGWGLRARVAALLLTPWRDGHPADGTWIHPFPAAAVSMSVGSVAFVLLLASPPRRRQRRAALALALVGGAAAALVWQVPGVADVGGRLTVLRVMNWSRAAFLVSFAIAMLAAIAADAWLRGRNPRRLIAAAVAVQVAILALGLTATGRARTRALRAAWVPTAVALSAPLAVAGGAWPVAILVLVEGALDGWQLLPASSTAGPGLPRALPNALRAAAATQGGRVLGLGAALPANLAAGLGLADLRSHDPVRPRALVSLHRALGAAGMDLPGEVTTPWAGLAGAWGVRWLVTLPVGVSGPSGATWEQVLTTEQGRLFRNPRALPVVRLALRTVSPPGDAGTGAWEGIDFATTAVCAPAIPLDGVGTITVLEARPWRCTVRVAAQGRVLALLHSPLAPGWAASIDGSPTQIVEANLGAMGVVVPTGRHEVRWKYAPVGLGSGIALTVLGLAGCLALAVTSGRRIR